MALSPRDIKAQTFKKTVWGYKQEDVDFFLEQIAKSVDELRREIDSLKNECDSSRQQICRYEEQTGAVKETLELAKEKGETIILRAKEHAQGIIDSAQNQAEEVLNSYQEEFNNRKQILFEFREISDSYKRKFQRMIEQKIMLMDAFESSFESRRALEFIEDMKREDRVPEPVSEEDWAHFSDFFMRRKKYSRDT